MEDTGQVKGTQIKIRNESNVCAPPAPRGLHSPHSAGQGLRIKRCLWRDHHPPRVLSLESPALTLTMT